MIVADDSPVERLMDTAFCKMRSLIDANTVVGTPITTADGVSIIPISRVTMGFVTGGGEYSDMSKTNYLEYPFAGGSGTGMNISPVAFIVNNGKEISLISVGNSDIFSKILDKLPKIMEKMTNDTKKDSK